MTDKIQHGIRYPIVKDSKGFFAPTYSTVDSTRSNIKNLILTKKGERPGRPEYGSTIWNYLFDQSITDLRDVISDVLAEDFARWMPEIIIDDISVSQSSDSVDIYKLMIDVKFRVSPNSETVTETTTITL